MFAGVRPAVYFRGLAASLIFGLAGAQFVHWIYQPLEGFQEDIDKRKAELRAEKAKAKEDSD